MLFLTVIWFSMTGYISAKQSWQLNKLQTLHILMIVKLLIQIILFMIRPQGRTGYLTADRAISEATNKNFLPARVVCKKLAADRASSPIRPVRARSTSDHKCQESRITRKWLWTYGQRSGILQQSRLMSILII